MRPVLDPAAPPFGRTAHDWIVLLCGAVVVVAGLVYMFTTYHYGRGKAAAGDAVPAK
ncbi:hypothetical protein [Streptomyces sp. NPDC040750]|uniref:hypothetical protein n=1 Tax=Streptomyces sp. NPDC040750 TaxID=3154491 RepID=UPI003409CC72